jgi:hypothetical protein
VYTALNLSGCCLASRSHSSRRTEERHNRLEESDTSNTKQRAPERTDILLGHVGKDQGPLGLVLGQAQTVGDHLVHGGDTASCESRASSGVSLVVTLWPTLPRPRLTSSDCDTVGKLVRLVLVLYDGSLEGQGLTGLQVGNVLGHLSGL